ncbi:Multimodular transpeptidase-transglycosylase [Polaromonas sp. CG9_12]|nr:Multimodular transpeptidase-transglycosylase [Polaromonas sp. CG9_12]
MIEKWNDLHLMPFRGELVGIDALSLTLFGKSAHRLDEREPAVAAARVWAPHARAAQVGQLLARRQPGCSAVEINCAPKKIIHSPATPKPLASSASGDNT